MCRRAAIVVVIGLFAPRAVPQDLAPHEIEAAIRDLGSSDFETRERATRVLWSAGDPVLPALGMAASGADPEVAERAGAILEERAWGLRPDTPESALYWIRRFRQHSDEGMRKNALSSLVSQGAHGHRFLFAVESRHGDEAWRAYARNLLDKSSARIAPTLLADGRDAEAIALLERGIERGDEDAAAGYAGLARLDGRLAEEIATWEAAFREGHEPAGRLLAYLFLVAGERRRAAEVGRRAGVAAVVQMAFYLERDWGSLAADLEERAAGARSESERFRALALAAACRDLAGDQAGADSALARARGLESKPRYHAGALLACGHADQALEVLLEAKQYSTAIDLAAARFDHERALALVHRAREAGGADWPPAALTAARLLHELGEEAAARAWLDEAAEAIGEGTDRRLLGSLAQVEMDLGLEERAFDRVHRALPNLQQEHERNGLVAWVLSGYEDSRLWWELVARRDPRASGPEIGRRVRAIMRGDLPPEELRALAAEACEGLGESERAAWDSTLSSTFFAAGRFDDAALHAERAVRVREGIWPFVVLGYLEARRGRWPEAAAAYRSGWERDPSDPIPLALHGAALARIGREEDSGTALRLARRIALGRDRVSVHLELRQFAEQARIERERSIEFDWEYAWYHSSVRVAAELAEAKEIIVALDSVEIDQLAPRWPRSRGRTTRARRDGRDPARPPPRTARLLDLRDANVDLER